MLNVITEGAVAGAHTLEVVGPSGAVATSYVYADTGKGYYTIQVDVVLQFDGFTNAYDFQFTSTVNSSIAGGYSSYICGHTI